MIGVFDSGVGGLTIVKEIFKQLPGYQIIYFGDTARLPYGTKGANFVKKYSEKITNWLLKKGAKIIVIACNTSSAWAADYLKKKFPEVPIFEMINPAIKKANKTGGPGRSGKVGVIGTPGTIKSGAYGKIASRACPLLVPLVEEGLISGEITKKILKNYLKSLKEKGINTLILGCTHYPLLKPAIEEIIGPKVKVINPAEAIAKEVKIYIEKNNIKINKSQKHMFYFSDAPYNLDKISHLCFSKKIKPIILDPFQ